MPYLMKYTESTNTPPSAGKIIGVIVALILLGVLLPIGMADILSFTNDNSTIQTLVTTVLPLMAVVGIVIGLIPKNKGGSE